MLLTLSHFVPLLYPLSSTACNIYFIFPPKKVRRSICDGFKESDEFRYWPHFIVLLKNMHPGVSKWGQGGRKISIFGIDVGQKTKTAHFRHQKSLGRTEANDSVVSSGNPPYPESRDYPGKQTGCVFPSPSSRPIGHHSPQPSARRWPCPRFREAGLRYRISAERYRSRR